MTGYTRQSAATIITGAEITAAPLNAEFNKLQDAFHATTGHTHSGATGDGPLLPLTSFASLADMRVIGNTSGAPATPTAVVILDEDNMATNSATALATQQSIKAYADLRLLKAGDTMSGDLAMGTNKVTGVGDPTSAQDVATKAYSDLKLPLAGGTMSGDITMGTNTVTGLGAPSAASDAATKSYVDGLIAATIDAAPGALDTLNELAASLGDDADFAGTMTTNLATKLPKAGGTMTGNIDMDSNFITNVPTPTQTHHATSKSYVDGILGSATAAAASAAAAEASYDSFDDRYLGAKTSDPTLDNDGNALLTGALYFDSTLGIMKVWDGAAWVQSQYDPTNVAITGGTINGTTIGATTASSGVFSSIQAGTSHSAQTSALVYSHDGSKGNSYEFGHANTAGYRSVIGFESSAGYPNIVFFGENDGSNLYRTRGFRASILKPDSTGGFLFQTVANANAAAQAPTNLATLTNGGIFTATGYQLGTSGRGLTAVTGSYGTIQTIGTGIGSYNGYNIAGNAVFMSNGTTAGLYDDTNDQWFLYGSHGGATVLHHAGSLKFNTTATGAYVTGSIQTPASASYMLQPTGENSGLYRESSGNISLFRGGGRIVEITSTGPIIQTGNISSPNVPAFSAVRTGAATTTTGLLEFSSALTNNGSHYNATAGNYRFTAPVGGRYRFTATIFADLPAAGDYCSFRFYKNGVSVGATFHSPSTNAGTIISYITIPCDFIVVLAASDYVDVRMIAQNGTGGIYGSTYSSFSGELIG